MRYAWSLILVCANALAIQTAYVSFQEPENWNCELAQGVWICQSNVPSDRRESVILSIAAQATEWDTLENYETYLKRPRNIQNQDGTTATSEITYTRRRNINGVWWMDSLQHNSELPGFWSRYLATVYKSEKTKLAILITYIVSDERYQKLAPQFERMVASLKPSLNVNVGTNQGNEFLDNTNKFGGLKSNILAERLDIKPSTPKVEEPEAPSSSPITILVLLGVLVGAVLFLFKKRRARKQKDSKKRGGPTSMTRTG